MSSALSSLVDRLQGFFNRGFFLLGFLPGVVFLVLNMLAMAAVFPILQPALLEFIKINTAFDVVNWFFILVGAFIFGIILSSLNQWLKILFEGRILPDWLQQPLIRFQAEQYTEKSEFLDAMKSDLVDFRKAAKKPPIGYGWEDKLRQARLQGENASADQKVSPDLKKNYLAIKKREATWAPVTFAEMKGVYNDLLGELSHKPADSISELEDINTGFLDLLEYACARIEVQPAKLTTEIQQSYPADQADIGPTRMANLTAITREYGKRNYGFDQEKYWLQILRLAKKDEQFASILEDSKTQLDFSISMTAVLLLTVLIWTFPAMLLAPTPLPFVIITGLGIPAIIIFYRILFENYRAYTEAVRSAIDLYRFDLLTSLHLPLPLDSKKEKEAWESLANFSRPDAPPIVFQHDPAGKKTDQPASASQYE